MLEGKSRNIYLFTLNNKSRAVYVNISDEAGKNAENVVMSYDESLLFCYLSHRDKQAWIPLVISPLPSAVVCGGVGNVMLCVH